MMPIGERLTEWQVDRILRLAGERDVDGEYLLPYSVIADQVGVTRNTVARTIRDAAVAWGRHTAWRKDSP